jgi:hemolysin D
MSTRHRLAAAGALLGHYRNVFAHFWKERESLATGRSNAAEAEFLPAALSLQESPVSPTARITGALLCAFAAIALIWAVFGKIDIVVNATGKIIPSGHSKTIASVEIASVRALHVEDGQAVKAGDVLIELAADSPDADHDKALGDQVAARLQMARSRALIAAVDGSGRPVLPTVAGASRDQWEAAQSHLLGQYQDFIAKLNRIEGDINRFETALPFATQRANDYRALSSVHDVPEHAWLEKEQARVDLQGQLDDAKNQRAALIAQTRKEARDALTESSRVAADNTQDARRASARSELMRLTAPVDGTVQQLTVHTVGGVVPAAQPLMLIVPRQGKVEVEATLENKDVGFVKVGQEVEVKIDAFEYTKFGTVPGHVTSVSRDAIQDEKRGLLYDVGITLDRTTIDVDGRVVPLTAGMSTNAEIKTGTRRVIEYILSPLVQHQKEALHER